jgi:hypothetical protein
MIRDRSGQGSGRDAARNEANVSAEARCRATKAAGEPCGASPQLIGEDGFCPAHRPGARERLSEAGRKGAEATARKWRGRSGLEPGELPELNTPHDAQAALDIVAHAAAEGRLPQRQADATTRAVREWLRAWEAGAVAEQIAQLQRKVAALGGEKLKVLP